MRMARPMTSRVQGLLSRPRRWRRRSRRCWRRCSASRTRMPDSTSVSKPKWRPLSVMASLRRFIRAMSARSFDHRPQHHSATDHDQQQRPRRAVRESEKVQRHGLQPRSDRDQPETRPRLPTMEERRDSDGDDDERPVVLEVIAEVADVKPLEQEGRPDADEQDAPEEGVRVDVAPVVVHVVLTFTFLISMPAISTSPRTINCRPPCAALVLMSMPPITGTTSP